MLYYAGVSIKDAQYLLGHSTASITLDIYTHLDKENNTAINQIENHINDNVL